MRQLKDVDECERLLRELQDSLFSDDGTFEKASKDYYAMLRTMVDRLKALRAQGKVDEEGLKEYFGKEALFTGFLAARMAFIKSAVNAGKAGGN